MSQQTVEVKNPEVTTVINKIQELTLQLKKMRKECPHSHKKKVGEPSWEYDEFLCLDCGRNWTESTIEEITNDGKTFIKSHVTTELN